MPSYILDDFKREVSVIMVKPTLLVMAAGMGSRFGGLKQISPLGPNGEILLDYSVYDAVKAGFGKIVFVIKKEIEKDFRTVAGKRIEKMCDVEYAFQELDKLPNGFSVPMDRTKPWGTGHAVLCAKDNINTPFAIINADDFYGASSYKLICDHLSTSDEKCMCGFKLWNTLSENGTVSRGVCDTENGYLKGVTEHTAIDKTTSFAPDTVVSMNMWGLTPDIFDTLEVDFEEFLKEKINVPKSEFFIPSVIDKLIKEKNERVKVITTDEKWYGVTYKEDGDIVKNALKTMKDEGKYDGI